MDKKTKRIQLGNAVIPCSLNKDASPANPGLIIDHSAAGIAMYRDSASLWDADSGVGFVSALWCASSDAKTPEAGRRDGREEKILEASRMCASAPSDVVRDRIEASRRLRGFPQRSAGLESSDRGGVGQRGVQRAARVRERERSRRRRDGGSEKEDRVHRQSVATSRVASSTVAHVFWHPFPCPFFRSRHDGVHRWRRRGRNSRAGARVRDLTRAVLPWRSIEAHRLKPGNANFRLQLHHASPSSSAFFQYGIPSIFHLEWHPEARGPSRGGVKIWISFGSGAWISSILAHLNWSFCTREDWHHRGTSPYRIEPLRFEKEHRKKSREGAREGLSLWCVFHWWHWIERVISKCSRSVPVIMELARKNDA